MTLRLRTLARRLGAVILALSTAGALASPAAAQDGGLDRQALRQSLDAVRDAGMYGIYSNVVDGRQSWKGASGVADVETSRPMRADMVHRAGSITKTFTSVAVLQQAGRGTIELDAPIGRYLPGLVPGERGQRITVRMLLNHTSHIADYDTLVFTSAETLEAYRFRTFAPEELVNLALAAPATGEPGTAGTYSNTNYILLGLLLKRVTGVSPERYITDNVIRRAGLRHTSFPRTPFIPGPHSKAYESLFGLIDPPKDFSVYNPSVMGMAGSIVSTMEDLNRFYRALLRGELLGAGLLAEMRKTASVDGAAYGLGIFPVDLPCGRFWGHNGGVFGMATFSFSSPDGGRQLSFGYNLTGYQRLDENGVPVPSPIDAAVLQHLLVALCGPGTARTSTLDGIMMRPRQPGVVAGW
ncbi:serine hydrolase domain-containing protein [Nonomuraea insulae]|uniref:Serine hydrolase domain-containing protein n=1 Tax=Nonomuraea insulae TaxID=1616787 RepID=A0ABW1CXR6_9ACTN